VLADRNTIVLRDVGRWVSGGLDLAVNRRYDGPDGPESEVTPPPGCWHWRWRTPG